MKVFYFAVLFFCLTVSIHTFAQITYGSDYNLRIDRPASATSFQGSLHMEGGNDVRFGSSTNGDYCIEYWDGGLNFFINWPKYNYGSYKLFIQDDGNVGVGKKPNYKLDVNGDIALSGSVIYSSDMRFKDNIQSLQSSLPQIRQLKGMSFTPVTNDTIWYKDSLDNKLFRIEKQKKQLGRRFGFIAQELQTVFPELVKANENGYLGVDYIGLIPVIIEALKEQQQIIDVQSEKLKKIENLLDSYGGKVTLRSGTAEETGTSLNSIADVSQASLYQNTPNPFSESTQIRFYLPEDVKKATLNIYNLQGKQLKQIVITQRGEGSQLILGSEFAAGIYLYALIADGNEVDVKRMILTE